MKFRFSYILMTTVIALCHSKASAMDSPEAQNPHEDGASPRTALLINRFSSPNAGIMDASPESKRVLADLQQRRTHLSEEAAEAVSDIHSPTTREEARLAHKEVLELGLSKEEKRALEKIRLKLERKKEDALYVQMKREGEEQQRKSREIMSRITNRVTELEKDLAEKRVIILTREQEIQKSSADLLESAAKLEKLEQKQRDLEAALTSGGVENETTQAELRAIKANLEEERKTRETLRKTTEALRNALTSEREEHDANVKGLTKQLAKMKFDKLRVQAQLETQEAILLEVTEGVNRIAGDRQPLPNASFDSSSDDDK